MLLIDEGYSTTLITFNNQRIVINETTKEIFEKSCLNYGTTLDGSIKAMKHHLKIRQKCPVLLSVYHQLLFFPIPLTNIQKKVWIRYLPSLTSKRISNHQCMISFKHQNITLDVDNRMVVRQIKRCKHYIDILNAYDLEYGLFYTNHSSLKLEDLLVTSNLPRKGLS